MTSDDKTKLAVMGMFAAYPSFQRSRDQMDLTLAAYSAALSGFHDADIAAGCARAMRAGGAFPPSSAELCKFVGDAAESRARADAYARDRRVPQLRLAPPPRHDYTDAELADFSLEINVRGAPYVCRMIGDQPLTIPPGYPGAGKPTFYGYLTPGEARTYPGARLGSSRPPRKGSMTAEEGEYRRAVAAGETRDFRDDPLDWPDLSPALRDSLAKRGAA